MTALILPGGGARGAYQAGVLKAIQEFSPSDVNPFQLCDYDQIIVSEKGLERLLARMNGGN